VQAPAPAPAPAPLSAVTSPAPVRPVPLPAAPPPAAVAALVRPAALPTAASDPTLLPAPVSVVSKGAGAPLTPGLPDTTDGGMVPPKRAGSAAALLTLETRGDGGNPAPDTDDGALTPGAGDYDDPSSDATLAAADGTTSSSAAAALAKKKKKQKKRIVGTCTPCPCVSRLSACVSRFSFFLFSRLITMRCVQTFRR
jgi:hypothetical protein